MIEFVSLDGVMQGLGSPEEDRDGGFEHCGWAAPYLDKVQQEAAINGLRSTTAYLFGRRTYQKMLNFWPSQPESNPMAAHLNATPKYVVTRTLTQFTWPKTEPLKGILSETVSNLKADGDGNIAVLGSGALVSELMTRDLVGEYRIFLHPLLIGSGKRLFPKLAMPKPLHLTGCTSTTTAVLLLSYQPAEQGWQVAA